MSKQGVTISPSVSTGVLIPHITHGGFEVHAKELGGQVLFCHIGRGKMGQRHYPTGGKGFV